MNSALAHAFMRPVMDCSNPVHFRDSMLSSYADLSSSVSVVTASLPPLPSRLSNWGIALNVGLQHLVGQFVSATLGELAGGLVTLVGNKVIRSSPVGALAVLGWGGALVTGANGLMSVLSTEEVRDAYSLRECTRKVLGLLINAAPVILVFSHASVDEDDWTVASALVISGMAGRITSNFFQDVLNESFKGSLAECKHVGADGKALSKPEILARRGKRLTFGPLLPNIGSALLVQFVVNKSTTEHFVGDIASDNVALLVDPRNIGAKALPSGALKGLYALSSNQSKAWAASNDELGGYWFMTPLSGPRRPGRKMPKRTLTAPWIG